MYFRSIRAYDPVAKLYPASTPWLGRTKECKGRKDPVRHGRVHHLGDCGDPLCYHIFLASHRNSGCPFLSFRTIHIKPLMVIYGFIALIDSDEILRKQEHSREKFNL